MGVPGARKIPGSKNITFLYFNFNFNCKGIVLLEFFSDGEDELACDYYARGSVVIPDLIPIVYRALMSTSVVFMWFY